MVEGMDATVVTVSGYCGSERMMLIKLISVAGANYVGKLSRSTTHLICWKFKGKKHEYAKKFGTLIINHQWLEDCMKEGKRIPESPYTLRSGQEVGFNIHSLPAVTKTAGLLSENKLLLNSPSIHDRLNDVIDLESDEIENDDWDHNLLLDENLFPVPGSRISARQLSKRKLVKETFREGRRVKADTKRAILEPEIPTVDGLQCEASDNSIECSIKQRRSDNDLSILPDFAESSRRSRRLVKKNAKRYDTEIASTDAEQQSRTLLGVNELPVASSLSNDLSREIEASIRRRLETMPAVKGKNRDEVNNMNDTGPLLDTSLHSHDASNAKGINIEENIPRVQNLNRDKLGRDQSTIGASAELSCVICWTEYSSLRGVLSCGHRFCFSCIQNWADHMSLNRKEATCPLCKASFTNITRVNAGASVDQKIYSQTIPCASSSQDIFFVSEGVASHSGAQVILPSVCCRCQQRDPEDLLMYCQMCQSSCIHHYCLDPPLFPWTCIGCRDRRLPFFS
ncbi:hypothetical protein SOVF_020900 [Spinacia oleracea]|uniref:RING-type E3 ubiquitin transferase BRCA1 n=1 Tax=Spinacia oleracea TaxID=3562 RepID=A0A9R0JCZ7_SPIOL|nr:uncharacterized protein LOC110803482 [Spinacia oleracea]XP_056694436.1 uncharacterized protein LOC110803482 [Spinacia oleracea]KNA23936.1 hypothetical protein SOVF_020900 [Spinacia oleracea]